MSQPRRDLRRRFRYCVRLSRVRGWWDNALHLAGAAYLLWDHSGPAGVDHRRLAAYVAAVVCLLMGGYALNDAADFPQDAAASPDDSGRPRREHSFAVGLTALAAGVILLLAATRQAFALGVGAAAVLVGVAYSAPPVRLKERGLWGVVLGAAAQRPALLLVFAAMLGAWNWLTVVLSLWLFCGSLLSLLGHQVLDYRDDLAAGVRTFTVRHGTRLSLRLCVVCGAGVGLTALAPLAFAPAAQAAPIVGVLAGLSLVYAGKGVRALRRIRAA